MTKTTDIIDTIIDTSLLAKRRQPVQKAATPGAGVRNVVNVAKRMKAHGRGSGMPLKAVARAMVHVNLPTSEPHRIARQWMDNKGMR